jgi:hypothetical protein
MILLIFINYSATLKSPAVNIDDGVEYALNIIPESITVNFRMGLSFGKLGIIGGGLLAAVS